LHALLLPLLLPLPPLMALLLRWPGWQPPALLLALALALALSLGLRVGRLLLALLLARVLALPCQSLCSSSFTSLAAAAVTGSMASADTAAAVPTGQLPVGVSARALQ
jgi:hypothetical protein